MKNRILDLLKRTFSYTQAADKGKVADVISNLFETAIDGNPKIEKRIGRLLDNIEKVDNSNIGNSNVAMISTITEEEECNVRLPYGILDRIIESINAVLHYVDIDDNNAIIGILIYVSLLGGVDARVKADALLTILNRDKLHSRFNTDTRVAKELYNVATDSFNKEEKEALATNINRLGIDSMVNIISILNTNVLNNIEKKVSALIEENSELEESRDIIFGLCVNNFYCSNSIPNEKVMITAAEEVLESIKEMANISNLMDLYNVIKSETIRNNRSFNSYNKKDELLDVYNKIGVYKRVTKRAPRNRLFYLIDSIFEDEAALKNKMLNIHKYLTTRDTYAYNGILLSSLNNILVYSDDDNEIIPIIRIIAEVGYSYFMAFISRLDVAVNNNGNSATQLYLENYIELFEIFNYNKVLLDRFTGIFNIAGKFAGLYILTFLEAAKKNSNYGNIIESTPTNSSRTKLIFQLVFNTSNYIPEMVTAIDAIIGEGTEYAAKDVLSLPKSKEVVKKAVPTTIPITSIIIENYEILELPKNSIAGPVIGAYTGCCQRLGGAAEFSAIHASVSNNATNIIVKRNGKIVANSWTWISGDTVVFDNIEAKEDGTLDKETIKELYIRFSEFLIEKGVREVRIGGGNNDIDINDFSIAKELIPTPKAEEIGELYNGQRVYSDANKVQLIIRTNKRSTMKEVNIEKIRNIEAAAYPESYQQLQTVESIGDIIEYADARDISDLIVEVGDNWYFIATRGNGEIVDLAADGNMSIRDITKILRIIVDNFAGKEITMDARENTSYKLVKFSKHFEILEDEPNDWDGEVFHKLVIKVKEPSEAL